MEVDVTQRTTWRAREVGRTRREWRTAYEDAGAHYWDVSVDKLLRALGISQGAWFSLS